MAKKTSVDDFADALNQILNDYVDNVNEGVYKAGRKAIKELERKTIDTAPIGRRGKFREAIASKSTRPDRLGRSTHIWYVKAPHYRLTHLLVHGHATRKGGRTRADPFLKNALEDVKKQFEDDVKEAVKNG